MSPFFVLSSTEYQFSEDNFAGSLADNGSWRGLIGVLSRQEIDVAVSAITMTPMRTEVVDFTLPIFLNRYWLPQYLHHNLTPRCGLLHHKLVSQPIKNVSALCEGGGLFQCLQDPLTRSYTEKIQFRSQWHALRLSTFVLALTSRYDLVSQVLFSQILRQFCMPDRMLV